MNRPRETVAKVRDEKDNRPLPHQIRRPRLTARGEKPSTESGSRDENSSDKRSRTPSRYRNCNYPSCNFWHLTSPRLDAHLATKAISDMLRRRRCPARSQRKVGGARGSVALLKESIQLGWVSQDSCPRKSILREQGKLGSKHAVKFSQGTWHQIKIRGRKGPIARNYPKVCAS